MGLYTKSWDKIAQHIRFCEYKLPLPVLPEGGASYELRVTGEPIPDPSEEGNKSWVQCTGQVYWHPDGKFHHTEIPEDLRAWEDEKKQAFIAAEWHKRENGVWWLLKISEEAKADLQDAFIPKELFYGDRVLVYFPGWYYFFLNYWPLQEASREDGRPDFRWTQCAKAQWWETKIVMDDLCNGGFGLKGRREGWSSQMAQCMPYEYASRVRKVHCGIQNVNEADAKDSTYMPIVDGHREMTWFFKPINQGTTEPKKGLIFKAPEKRITDKSLKEEHGIYDDTGMESKPLGSRITYKASKEEAYDKARLARYIMEEPGKMKPKNGMNPREAWKLVRPCTELNNGALIVGKAAIGTTVEEMEDDDGILEVMRLMWDESDPKKRNAHGKTTNGLKRILITADLTGEYDDYGFPLISRNRQNIEITIDDLRKQRKWKDIADYKRKYPMHIDDILTPSAKKCHFNLTFLQDRHKELMTLKAAGDTRLPVKVRLVWAERFRRVEIIQVPDAEEGDDIAWCSYIPQGLEKNNVSMDFDGMRPQNKHLFAIGVDTYDHTIDPEATEHDLSDGAFVVRIRFNALKDANKLVPTTGFPSDDQSNEHYLGRGMESKRTCMTFRFRYKDPEAFYEMVAKAAILYGSMVNVESNKITIESFFKQHGLKHFLKKDKQGKTGTYSSQPVISNYFDLISISVEHFINAEWHPEIIEERIKMQKAKMTKYDLGVADGMAHILESETVTELKKFAPGDEISYYSKRKRVFAYS